MRGDLNVDLNARILVELGGEEAQKKKKKERRVNRGRGEKEGEFLRGFARVISR